MTKTHKFKFTSTIFGSQKLLNGEQGESDDFEWPNHHMNKEQADKKKEQNKTN